MTADLQGRNRGHRGRPCSVCGHVQRSAIENAIASGEALSAISASFALSRQAVRRHRDAHMAADASAFHDGGIGPYATVVRLTQAADRLRDLATEAEDRGRIADAVRATLAESRTLATLFQLGVKGGGEIEQAKDAAELEAGVVALVRRAPVAGEVIAAELESRGRDALAGQVRTFAQRCKAVSENERQEITNV